MPALREYYKKPVLKKPIMPKKLYWKKKKPIECERCGRDSHEIEDCYASRDTNGDIIVDESEEELGACERCGRDSHEIEDCYASRDINGDIIVDEPEKESGVYVLKLRGGNYYVGKSDDIETRINQHESGKGSSWSKLHGVIGKQNPITSRMDDLDSWERAETIEQARIHGIEKVRGHSWTTINLTVNMKKEFVRHIRDRYDLCRRCGSSDHMISTCRSRGNIDILG